MSYNGLVVLYALGNREIGRKRQVDWVEKRNRKREVTERNRRGESRKGCVWLLIILDIVHLTLEFLSMLLLSYSTAGSLFVGLEDRRVLFMVTTEIG